MAAIPIQVTQSAESRETQVSPHHDTRRDEPHFYSIYTVLKLPILFFLPYDIFFLKSHQHEGTHLRNGRRSLQLVNTCCLQQNYIGVQQLQFTSQERISREYVL